MDVTNRYVLDYARRCGGRVLDYGCGGGELVEAGGESFYGADVFYGGSQAREQAEARGLLGGRVLEIVDGRIPFPDNHFDVVVNNQVMEHVEDLEAVLGEIARVLAPGGRVLSVFPSRDVWREGHIGIPFAHRLPRGSRVRFLYTWVLRAAGFGTWKEQAPTARAWAVDKLNWIDVYTCYRERSEILRVYNRYFLNRFREGDYIRFRLLDAPGGWRRMAARVAGWGMAVALFRKLAFLVIESEKR
jgi:SAM-dependent methyltransferase